MEETEDGTDRECEPRRGGGPNEPPSNALGDRYRRHTYRILCEVDSGISVARLARRVVARTAEKSPDVVSLDEQKRMYTALDRSHLPALEAADLIDRDHARGRVAPVDPYERPTRSSAGDPTSGDATDGTAKTNPDASSRPG